MGSRAQRAVAIGMLALILVGAVIRFLPTGGAAQANGTRVSGGQQSAALFRGIPQHGNVLGNPSAPVTLIEFADLQCPFCARFARSVLPSLVARYVGPGKVRVVFRNLAVIGPDSDRAARMAAAAGLQDRLWQFTDLVFRNQGRENSGYVTDAYLRRVAQAAGVDAGRAFADRDGRTVEAQLKAADDAALRLHVDSTPSFFLQRGASRTVELLPSALSPGPFLHAIHRALARR